MDLYELKPTSTIYMDGTAEFQLRHKGKAGIICQMRLPMGDMDFWNRLLNSQAEKAWEAGAEAMCGQDNGGPMAVNPYTKVAETE